MLGHGRKGFLTSYGMVAPVFRPDAAVAIAVEACHG